MYKKIISIKKKNNYCKPKNHTLNIAKLLINYLIICNHLTKNFIQEYNFLKLTILKIIVTYYAYSYTIIGTP